MTARVFVRDALAAIMLRDVVLTIVKMLPSRHDHRACRLAWKGFRVSGGPEAVGRGTTAAVERDVPGDRADLAATAPFYIMGWSAPGMTTNAASTAPETLILNPRRVGRLWQTRARSRQSRRPPWRNRGAARRQRIGKTTLLRRIIGLERPDSGSIMIGGVDLTAFRGGTGVVRRKIGVAFQESALFSSP
jgi:hypothetical protein